MYMLAKLICLMYVHGLVHCIYAVNYKQCMNMADTVVDSVLDVTPLSHA